MPVLFITDALVFLLLMMVLSFIWYARGQEHLRAPWRTVARNPMAMASAVILFFYLLIGLSDSIHFHPRLESVNHQLIYAHRMKKPIRRRLQLTLTLKKRLN
jgi:peptide/nickel transport system permease protein